MPDSVAPSWRARRGLFVCGSVLALALALPWWVGHQATLRVSAVTGMPQCNGTAVTTVDDPRSDLQLAAIPMTEGFVCTVTIKVMNHSDREVTLSRVTVPVGGPGASSSFHVTHIGNGAVLANDQVDAVSDVTSSLEPGAEQLLDLRVAFRESGCTSEDGYTWVYPTIEVDDLLASHDLTIADLPGFLGTADSSCDF